MSAATAPNPAARSSNDVEDARARAAADAVINGSERVSPTAAGTAAVSQLLGMLPFTQPAPGYGFAQRRGASAASLPGSPPPPPPCRLLQAGVRLAAALGVGLRVGPPEGLRVGLCAGVRVG